MTRAGEYYVYRHNSVCAPQISRASLDGGLHVLTRKQIQCPVSLQRGYNESTLTKGALRVLRLLVYSTQLQLDPRPKLQGNLNLAHESAV